jgi:hypothetical protein
MYKWIGPEELNGNICKLPKISTMPSEKRHVERRWKKYELIRYYEWDHTAESIEEIFEVFEDQCLTNAKGRRYSDRSLPHLLGEAKVVKLINAFIKQKLPELKEEIENQMIIVQKANKEKNINTEKIPDWKLYKMIALISAERRQKEKLIKKPKA